MASPGPSVTEGEQYPEIESARDFLTIDEIAIMARLSSVSSVVREAELPADGLCVFEGPSPR
jgi:hypothetical protein